jgi:hypothetical protein
MHRANTLIWDGPTLQKQPGHSSPSRRKNPSFTAKHVNAYHTMRGAAVQSPVRRGGCLCLFMYVRYSPHASVSAVCVPPREHEKMRV